MNLVRRQNILYLRKRVPRRYQPVEDRDFIWISLATDSETVAQQKAPTVWADMIDAWEAKLEGRSDDAEKRLAAAKNLAKKRGYRYMPATEVAKLPLEELLTRVESVVTAKGKIDIQEAEAVLGVAEIPSITVSKALDLYWSIAKAKTAGKTKDQIRRWENPRKKAIHNFIEVVGNRRLDEITTADLFAFRAWWVDKMMAEGLSPGSVNKDMVHLTALIRDVARANDITLNFSTDRLKLDQGKPVTRPAFSTEWIKTKILAPDALKGLNGEAKAIVLGMVNTGYRPSEGAALRRNQIRLDVDIPHISIEPTERALKTHNSQRVIPLCGVSLDALKEFPDGFPRYFDNPSLSDTVNKFLRENKLLETPEHTLYCLRHSFEDRALAAGVDERIRRDLMGHALSRERYGNGASLELLHELVSGFAL